MHTAPGSRASASSRTSRNTAWCPRCTPSYTPMVTTAPGPPSRAAERLGRWSTMRTAVLPPSSRLRGHDDRRTQGRTAGVVDRQQIAVGSDERERTVAADGECTGGERDAVRDRARLLGVDVDAFEVAHGLGER